LADPEIRRATQGFAIVSRASEADFMIFDLDHPPRDWANYVTNPWGLTTEIGHCLVLNIHQTRKPSPIQEIILKQLEEVFALHMHVYDTVERMRKHLEHELAKPRPRSTATELALAFSKSKMPPGEHPPAAVMHRVPAEPFKAGPQKRLFISYSQHDRGWVEKLRTMCAPMSSDVDLWEDSRIKPGEKWREAIQEVLDTATVAVLMVSPEFLKSDFITENELPSLLAAAQSARELKVLWIAVEHSMYKLTAIEQYQCVNNPARPLSSIGVPELNYELMQIANRIHDACLG
jgi:hypothetical protein